VITIRALILLDVDGDGSWDDEVQIDVENDQYWYIDWESDESFYRYWLAY
jgi:hypothetical protein